MSEPDSLHIRRQRLRWRCRRGMQEMDIMLLRYLEQLDVQEDGVALERLERLLDCEDDALWDWLSGRAAPDDAQLGVTVQAIRECPPPAR